MISICKDKREENKLYKKLKNGILYRKKNPEKDVECEIEVSLRTLLEDYPHENSERLKKIIKRLHKDNLFDRGYIDKLFFYYKGSYKKKNDANS